MISPTVGENLVDEDVEDKEEGGLEEHKEENPSDQTVGSDGRIRIEEVERGEVPTASDDEEEEDEEVQREGKRSVVEEEEEDEDMGQRPPTKKIHLGRGARMALDAIPRTHKLALMMRNIVELSAMSGHSLRWFLRMDASRKKYRREMRRLKAENDRLKGELTSERKRLIELADASLRLKEDVMQVTKDKQTVEEENEKLKAELEKEKGKRKRLRERIVMLHNDLLDKSLKNDMLHTELNETCQKLTKGIIPQVRLNKGVKHLLNDSDLEMERTDETGIQEENNQEEDQDPTDEENDETSEHPHNDDNTA
ncbi:hypothetical protein Dimus_022413 [Dionaea muscipula]